MKLAPFLKFERIKEDGSWEAVIYPFENGTEGMYALIGRDHSSGAWTVQIVQDMGTDGYPIFAGNFAECKRFVRLMWESLRTFN